MKILHVVGARPNFMKAAPVIEALREHRVVEQRLVHTGQHYDEKMSKVFFDQLGMPRPDFDLGVGSGSHARQTADIMQKFEPILLGEKPDWLVVYGDVNSTIATAIVAAKLGVRIAHVEAGLRSGDRSMPEEVNRIITDAIADLLFVTEPGAVKNLELEGKSPDRIRFVGNSMIDSLLKHREAARKTSVLADLDLLHAPASNGDTNGTPASVAPYGVLTLHRPANVDDPTAFGEILVAILQIADGFPILFPCHPRTRSRIAEHGLLDRFVAGSKDGRFRLPERGVVVVEPQGYLEFVNLVANSRLVLTDSGGVQEETTVLRVPCLTLRDNTERPVTITHGTNILAGTKSASILEAYRRLRNDGLATAQPPSWDGQAARRIARDLVAMAPPAPAFRA